MCSLLQEEAVGHGEFQAISKPTLVPRQHRATTTVRIITSRPPTPFGARSVGVQWGWGGGAAGGLGEERDGRCTRDYGGS